MAVSLTEDELAFINAHRLNADALPKYFNARVQKDVAISRDFEAYLILAPNALKAAAITWITTAVQLNHANQLRDTLMQRATTQEKSNSTLEYDAYQKELLYFQKFKDSFGTGSEFATVTEVQLFLSDLQSVMDELATNSDRALYALTLAEVVSRYNDKIAVSQALVEELQSWQVPLSTYLGNDTPPTREVGASTPTFPLG